MEIEAIEFDLHDHIDRLGKAYGLVEEIVTDITKELSEKDYPQVLRLEQMLNNYRSVLTALQTCQEEV